MRRVGISGLLLLIALVASPARAVITTTQTLSFRSVAPGSTTQSLAQFAIPGSTLLSVIITWRPSVNGTVTITSNSGNSRTLQTSVTINSILSSSAFTIDSTLATPAQQYLLTRAGSTTINVTSNFAETVLSPATLAAFIGNNVIPIVHTLQNVVTTTTRVTGGNGNLAVATNLNDMGELTVVYVSSDVATVPEPQTWALLIAGFGLVGGGLRVQRRKLARARH